MRHLLTAILALLITTTASATDVNTASEAELDGIQGVGPALSGKILQARRQGAFKSWDDLMQRVKGIQPRRAHQLSAAGLRVDGLAYESTVHQTPTKAP